LSVLASFSVLIVGVWKSVSGYLETPRRFSTAPFYCQIRKPAGMQMRVLAMRKQNWVAEFQCLHVRYVQFIVVPHEGTDRHCIPLWNAWAKAWASRLILVWRVLTA
jgi:hypothetical protein